MHHNVAHRARAIEETDGRDKLPCTRILTPRCSLRRSHRPRQAGRIESPEAVPWRGKEPHRAGILPGVSTSTSKNWFTAGIAGKIRWGFDENQRESAGVLATGVVSPGLEFPPVYRPGGLRPFTETYGHAQIPSEGKRPLAVLAGRVISSQVRECPIAKRRRTRFPDDRRRRPPFRQIVDDVGSIGSLPSEFHAMDQRVHAGEQRQP